MTTTLSLVPLFGACVSNSSGESRCVLTSSSCASTETFVPSVEGSMHCLATNVVAGRCTSPLDDNRCATTFNACTNTLQFGATDPNCTAVFDLVTTATTIYPACSDPSDSLGNHVCALDASYCVAGESLNAVALQEEWTEWHGEWTEPCTCDDVPVGICYTNGVLDGSTSITPTNSFCATTSADCPSNTHSFMGAREFMGHDLASYECRLCNLHSTYAGGACRDTASQTDHCVLEESDCTEEHSEFVSSGELYDTGRQCLITDSDLSFGRCMSDLDLIDCTNKKESCLFPARFEPSDSCGMYENSNSNFPTYFPFCSPNIGSDVDWREIRCVWDSNECDTQTEHFEEAKSPESGFDGCLCEDVYTGVCEYKSGVYRCAVSAEACADQSTYIPQRLLAENGINDKLCPLCPNRGSAASPTSPALPVANPTLSPVAPVSNPVANPTVAPNNSNLTPESTESELSTGAVVGIAVGVAVVMLIFSVVCGFTKFSQKEPIPAVQENAENPVCEGGETEPAASNMVDGEVVEELIENKQGTMS